jgi:hypothetical protein
MEAFMKMTMRLALVLGLLVTSLAAFAEAAAQEYTVKTVTGKVEREVSAGTWEAVTPGMKLAPSAVVNTGLNSSLVLNSGERVVTIKAMQKGAIDKLVATNTATKGGIKIGAKVSESSVSTDSSKNKTTNVSTASTRASDATKDLEWAEE